MILKWNIQTGSENAFYLKPETSFQGSLSDFLPIRMDIRTQDRFDSELVISLLATVVTINGEELLLFYLTEQESSSIPVRQLYGDFFFMNIRYKVIIPVLNRITQFP